MINVLDWRHTYTEISCIFNVLCCRLFLDFDVGRNGSRLIFSCCYMILISFRDRRYCWLLTNRKVLRLVKILHWVFLQLINITLMILIKFNTTIFVIINSLLRCFFLKITKMRNWWLLLMVPKWLNLWQILLNCGTWCQCTTALCRWVSLLVRWLSNLFIENSTLTNYKTMAASKTLLR